MEFHVIVFAVAGGAILGLIAGLFRLRKDLDDLTGAVFYMYQELSSQRTLPPLQKVEKKPFMLG